MEWGGGGQDLSISHPAVFLGNAMLHKEGEIGYTPVCE